MKRLAWIALVAAGALSMSGCATVNKVLNTVTPEISVGVYKDGVGGITVGVKLEKAKEDPQPAKVEEPVKEETK